MIVNDCNPCEICNTYCNQRSDCNKNCNLCGDFNTDCNQAAGAIQLIAIPIDYDAPLASSVAPISVIVTAIQIAISECDCNKDCNL